MDRNILEDLLDRYIEGEVSEDENDFVENWLEGIDNPRSEWYHLDQEQKDKWMIGIFDQIQKSTKNVKIASLPSRKHLWLKVAAVAAVAMICFGLYQKLVVSQKRSGGATLATLKTPLNLKKHIILADSTRVWINAGSQLNYPQQFKGKTREVYLSGEAYFDIKHNANRPFIVHTGELITTVLGTAFDIKEEKENHTVVVTVTRGKVSVANGTKQLGIITPNQQIRFNSSNNQFVQLKVDAKLAIAWQEHDLHFEDITFAEAAQQLQQRFNVKINFSNIHIKKCKFTGTALKGEKLDKILSVICAFNKATYEIRPDNSIMIDGAGCD